MWTCYLLRAKWHKDKTHTHKKQTKTQLQPEEKNCANKLRFIFIKSPLGRIPDCMTKPSQSVQRMCINVVVQQKGVKFLFTAESVQSPFFLLITGRECSLVCKGPLNSRLCPDSLAEHLVCKHVPPKQRVPFAGTSPLPYCGRINFLHCCFQKTKAQSKLLF